MATFSVVLFTVVPPNTPAEAAGVTGGSFIKIDGREALLRSVELFLNRDNVKQIQIAFTADDLEDAKRKHGGHFGFSGVKVISGGPRWIDQIAAAAPKLADECSHVIVHDAARPAVPYSDLEALMEAAEKNDAVSLVTPLRAPLVELDEGNNPLAFLPAGRYCQLLMPQVFSKQKFTEMAASRKEPHASQFTLLRGSPLNLRLAGGADASLVRAMIGLMPKPKAKPLNSPFEEAQW